MKYSSKIYDKAFNIIKSRKAYNELNLQKRQDEIYKAIPQIKEIDKEIASVSIQVARAVLAKNDDIPTLIEGLKQRNIQLNAQKKDLLAQSGIPADFLTEQYTCPICKDTGFVNSKRCSCFETELKTAAFEELNKVSPLKLSSFETFDLNYYSKEKDDSGISPFDRMERIFNFCKNYSQNFSLESESLIFTGGTGLGKTHLSLAIAKSAIDKGYGVIYDSCQNILTKIEREYFGKEKQPEDFTSAIYQSDLLIIDDLGVEFSTSFTQSMIYNIINTRLGANLPTIISTNLLVKELGEKYSDRVSSRITSSFNMFSFKGTDIRIQKMIKNKTKI